ncbi:hypothetical protein DKB98_05795 [Enterococcus faecalis]|nr:hypothetical protein DKC02_03890 [Enterococcus faecalis]PWI85455.1 hypothetical protein DKC03_12485 [Enterococcus faecalis]PWI87858.1 hypothetical protein DKB98_05795 [Enterococcus faecalis]
MKKNNIIFSKKGVLIFFVVMVWNFITQIYFLGFNWEKLLEIFISTIVLFIVLGLLENIYYYFKRK